MKLSGPVAIIARIETRLDDLGDEILHGGELLVSGSKRQPIANPLLRLEQSLRVELRRGACETRLATLAEPSPLTTQEIVKATLGRNPRRTNREH